MNNLQKILGSAALLGALSGSAKANDYVQEHKWGLFGAGHTVVVTHTEPGIISVPQRVLYRDACGNCREGISYAQQPAEIITNQCRNTHVHWDKSFIAAPGNLLKAVGEAITPKGRGPGCTTCYTAPVYAPAPVTSYGCGCR